MSIYHFAQHDVLFGDPFNNHIKNYLDPIDMYNMSQTCIHFKTLPCIIKERIIDKINIRLKYIFGDEYENFKKLIENIILFLIYNLKCELLILNQFISAGNSTAEDSGFSDSESDEYWSLRTIKNYLFNLIDIFNKLEQGLKILYKEAEINALLDKID